jgi:hypothetical protein
MVGFAFLAIQLMKGIHKTSVYIALAFPAFSRLHWVELWNIIDLVVGISLLVSSRTSK